MDNDLKNKIILILVTAIIASVGFLAKDFIKNKKEEKTNIFNNHKDLYYEGTSSIENVNKTYSELYDLYDKSYGLTPVELEKKHNAFKHAVDNYSLYIIRLESLGSESQIKAGKNYEYWLNLISKRFDMQFRFSTEIESSINSSVEEFMLAGNRQYIISQDFNSTLNSGLKDLVNIENETYYSLKYQLKPMLDKFGHQFNLPFKKSLDIEGTNDLIVSPYEKYDKTIGENLNERYESNPIPFLYAQNRSFNPPTFKLKDNKTTIDTNEKLAEKTKTKFIKLAVDRDKDLQATIARKNEIP